MKSFREYLKEATALKFKKEGNHYKSQKTTEGEFVIINNLIADNGQPDCPLFISTNDGDNMEWLGDSKQKRDLVISANRYALANNLI